MADDLKDTVHLHNFLYIKGMRDVVFICDDAYAMPTAVSVQSVISHSMLQGPIYVHICTLGLTAENLAMFEGLNSANTIIQIHVIPKEQAEDKIRLVSQKTHVSVAALIKFELPNIFPSLDRILYLDSDIIVKGSLRELSEIDMREAYLAASFDYWRHYKNLRYMPTNLKSEGFYFNSGVMLLNLKKMREDGIAEKLWTYKINSATTKLMDQESFNAVCLSNVKPLSVKWNFNPIFLTEELFEELNEFYGENYSSVGDMQADIRIIHYVGKSDKPWVYSTAKMRQYWQSEFDKLNLQHKLCLKPHVAERRSLVVRSIEGIKKYGWSGCFSFLRYCICNKFPGWVKRSVRTYMQKLGAR